MISWLARQLRYFHRLLNTHDSPRQLACGFAFGVLIGVLPKGNLLAVAIGVLFFTVRVNLSVGMLAAVALSFIAGYIDPLAHRIGAYLLSARSLQGVWTELFNLPLVPWTRFNNTVVLGNLVLGVAAFYPVYLLVLPLFTWCKDLQQRRAAKANAKISSLELQPSPVLLACRRQQFAAFLAEIESLSHERRAA